MPLQYIACIKPNLQSVLQQQHIINIISINPTIIGSIVVVKTFPSVSGVIAPTMNIENNPKIHKQHTVQTAFTI